jgi:hypothetical protein
MVGDIFKHALMVTSFVLIMMLLIEYINVQTRGIWQKNLRQNRFGQYLLGAFLGVIPGCLGAFTAVSLYSHRMVSFGALVAAMIATSGDEAFVMLAMFPLDAIYLNLVLFVVALLAGALSDRIFTKQERFLGAAPHDFELHEEKMCYFCSKKEILLQLREMTYPRALLITVFALFMAALLFGQLGLSEWNWKKVTFAAGGAFALFIVITVPEHFLKEHIYDHIIKKHLVRIFLWTFAALLAVHYMESYLDVGAWLRENTMSVLVAASLLGIIPESGPHLIFATMYAKGLTPFAVLLASSISQDGHGTLPLLAVSVRAFFWLQVIAVVVAITVGTFFLLLMA